MDLIKKLVDGTKKRMNECNIRRAHYEKVLLEELDENIDGEALSRLKVDQHVILLKIFNFFFQKKKDLFEFMLNNRDNLFSNDEGILHVFNVFQDYKLYIEKN